MREQEFARFFLITETWAPTSGVQKVWTGLKLVWFDALYLDQILGVLFLITASAYMNAYVM